MTAGRAEPEFTALDAYIAGQLAFASAALARHTDAEVQLRAILHAVGNADGAGQDQAPDID